VDLPGLVAYGPRAFSSGSAVADFPEDVTRFVRENVTSVGQLEVLLTLAGNPDRSWNASEVSRELYTTTHAADYWLADLCMRGLLTAIPGPPLEYRFAPRNPTHARLVTELDGLYHARPVSVIALIYSRR
jgi:hypothetical protein